MAQDKLESVVREKIKPIIDQASERLIGINIAKISDDISTRIEKSSFMDIEVDTTLRYREAKKKFRKRYLTKLLLLKLGNISEVAKAAETDRRTVHRLIKELDIDVKKIKDELLKPYAIKVSAVSSIIEGVLDTYKTIIHPEKLSLMYGNATSMSENIVNELPTTEISLKQAEELFEAEYLKRCLEQHGNNMTKAARAIGLRYETFHRKLKELES